MILDQRGCEELHGAIITRLPDIGVMVGLCLVAFGDLGGMCNGDFR